MIEDIYNPVQKFRSEFRDKFKDVAEQTFDDLLKHSGLDVEANKEIVNKINSLEQIIDALEKRIAKLSFWQVVLWLIVIGCIIAGAYCYSEALYRYILAFLAGLVVSLVVLFRVIKPRKDSAKRELQEEQASVEKNKEIAWEQMRPLNRLFDWDITVRMISKTVPRIHFDPFFTKGRLSDLYAQFGWDDLFNQDKSVLFTHSGEINGNPFILGRTMSMQWGEKTYHGSRDISYWVRNGKNSYRRTETLDAEVVKPYPEYFVETFLIYGCDAAPSLVFHRNCSGLANKENTFWGKLSKNAERKKLEKFSRNLEDESQYTMMSNRDFETLFNTMDRNNEVEYRLLFTPIAQTQMLEIMRNKTEGYGDDFSFDKLNKVNCIKAIHLDNLELDNNPERYKSYSVEQSRSKFMMYNQEYFRALYFAFAPLLAIPLYQQTRTHGNIYGIRDNYRSCFWEHEAIANFYGDEKFKHPDCVTHSILKTTECRNSDATSQIEVTAYGYTAEDRVESVCVRGGDGRKYNVDVHWDEYLPVSQTSYLRIQEDMAGFESREMDATERADYISRKEGTFHNGVYRRSMLSGLD